MFNLLSIFPDKQNQERPRFLKPIYRVYSSIRVKANQLGWLIVQKNANRKQDMKSCNRILRLHGNDIARSPYLDKRSFKHRRVPDDKELFHEIYQQFLQAGINDFARFFLLFTQARRVIEENVPGDFAELGVYKGTTAKIILQCCEDRQLHLFDTFEGQPDNVDEQVDGKAYAYHVREISKLSDTSLQEVKSRLGLPSNAIYHKGYFPNTAYKLKDTQFAFVHLDGDQYQTTKDGCEFFFPRLSSRGILICHDYLIYEGVRRAIDEYFADRREVVIKFPDAQGSVFVIKGQF